MSKKIGRRMWLDDGCVYLYANRSGVASQELFLSPDCGRLPLAPVTVLTDTELEQLKMKYRKEGFQAGRWTDRYTVASGKKVKKKRWKQFSDIKPHNWSEVEDD